MAVNMNEWATKITEKEGGEINLSIAQVKEVMRLILLDLKDMSLEEIAELLNKVEK